MTTASQYPNKFKCPSYGGNGGPVIDHAGEAALMGSAIHSLIARYLDLGDMCEDVAPVAAVYGVDAAELDALYDSAVKTVDRALDDIPFPVVETHLRISERSGTPDVYAITDDALFAVDWKSGWQTDPSAYWPQVQCYLWMLLNIYGERREYIGRIANLRTGEVFEQRLDDAALDAWAERADRADRDAGRVYSPGEVCKYCPSRHDCAARATWMQSGVTAMAEYGQTGVVSVASLWPRYQAACDAVAEFERTVRELVDANGPIDLGDGTRLVLTETLRDKLDAAKAWPVLTSHGLTGAEIVGAMTLAKGKLLDVYSAQYGRGMKGAAKMKLLDALREAGAVEVTSNKTLKQEPNNGDQ